MTVMVKFTVLVLPVKLMGYLDALKRTTQQEFHQRAFKTPLKLEHLNRKNYNKNQFFAGFGVLFFIAESTQCLV